MGEHVYILAQFPLLEFETQEFPNSESFISECEKWISENEIEIIRNISLKGIAENTLNWLTEFENLKKSILDDTFHWRQGKKENLIYLKEDFEKLNPLEREIYLLRVFWNWVTEQFVSDIDFMWLVQYLLKIKILEQKAKFDTETGTKVFDELVSSLTHTND